MIIAIEGGDACGKATQSKILAERLRAVRFGFPDYETTAGKAILGNLKSEWDVGVRIGKYRYPSTGEEGEPFSKEQEEAKHINALVLQSLMLINRMERGAELAAAARAGHVVLDRYDASAIVYGSLDGLDPEWLRATNAQLHMRPELYILLDAPVDEGFRRRPERRDRYEKDRAYLERVRVAYLRLFAERQEENAARARGDGVTRRTYVPGPAWRVIDAIGTVDEVAERVWAACVAAGA